ncbi:MULTISPECIES: hypothetical protein [Acidianus]|uniref:Acid-resistance membrane protein n=1 Tax=Candidatus Acidianus copahuensis TaxID=1160895 RepID=A0A031LU36_9CREN|nr:MULTISPECIES: hypothetical protein [Acidianus]EZQ11275.1 hypothetical protein CM19_01830 [Candidatus Acidianus copahuensis]NON62970.1 hypothetical protein [Acidianus sp. RZ1]
MRKFRLNPRPYAMLRTSSLFLTIFSVLYALSFEGIKYSFNSPLLMLALIFLFLFGYLTTKALDGLGHAFRLTVKLFYLLIAGCVSLATSALLPFKSVVLFLYIGGIIMMLAYLLSFSSSILNLGNQFNFSMLKISSAIIFFSLLVYAIIGAIPFSFMIFVSGIIIYFSLSRLTTSSSR